MSQCGREPCGGELRGVDVALNLAERDRSFGRSAVGVEDRIERILPALMEQPGRRAARVLEEAVAIRIAVAIDPVERRFDVRPKRTDECAAGK